MRSWTGGIILGMSVLSTVGVGASVVALAAESGMKATASMNELMVKIVQPTSDAVFYISRTPPQNDSEWVELEQKTLMLAESANLLLMPGYVRSDREQWVTDSLMMRDASVAAYRAAMERDVDALIDLNNDLYTSCESCHDAAR